MKRFIKKVFFGIVFMTAAFLIVAALCVFAVLALGARWTIAFNIATFVVAVAILAMRFVGKFVTTADTSNKQDKRESFLPRLAKALYSIFF
ncbi:MAG: hypothetical protein M3384_20140 [Acidobacteriota bacterium]|nr:hypothetical protein [Acidobacteriota bacterium]